MKLLVFFINALLLPFGASAHVRWFVDADALNSVRPYSFSDGPVIAWIFIALFVIGVSIFFEKKIQTPLFFSQSSFKRLQESFISLFSVFTGLGFIIFSFGGYVFAPNIIAHDAFSQFLLALQIVVGVSFLLGITVRLGAVLLLVLYAMAVWQFGLVIVDALEIIGISMMLFVMGRPRWCIADIHIPSSVLERFTPYAIPALRVFTGLNLVLLGFSEKILNPELGITFLAQYPWNFMSHLGFFGYTDYWFVLSAGVVEVLLGIIFVLGLTTRAVVCVTAFFFLVTLALLGPVELAGHTLHFAILAILFVFGSGDQLKLIRKS